MSPPDRGSSPHTRDKFDKEIFKEITGRIIPAYAGQIRLPDEMFLKIQDHPRIRGTNLAIETRTTKRRGSSPHTRDKFYTISFKEYRNRIIPAYAGQMKESCNDKGYKQDHPRIRGTNVVCLILKRIRLGSSPHTRDKFNLPAS